MTILEILKIIAGIATILTGMVSLFWPLKIRGFTGLEVNGGRGVTEIRTILGGFLLGLEPPYYFSMTQQHTKLWELLILLWLL